MCVAYLYIARSDCASAHIRTQFGCKGTTFFPYTQARAHIFYNFLFFSPFLAHYLLQPRRVSKTPHTNSDLVFNAASFCAQAQTRRP